MATRRVVIIGPEATGKTTLASDLAVAFGAPWVPEAARLVAASARRPLSALTVEPIARLSMELEDEALKRDPALLIRDTDLVSTVVYARHYYGDVPGWIVEEARARRADLYLLCRPDLPWRPDGIRDRPLLREGLFADFAAELRALAARIVLVEGTGEPRAAAAVTAVAALLKGAAPVDPPLR